jgi:hypothetical protein
VLLALLALLFSTNDTMYIDEAQHAIYEATGERVSFAATFRGIKHLKLTRKVVSEVLYCNWEACKHTPG